MKRKTIVKQLTKKFDEFVASIADESLAKAVRRDAIITGGCIVSMLLGEKINDYDIYFRTKDTALAVAMHYVALYEKENPNKDIVVSDRGDRIHIRFNGVAPKALEVEDDDPLRTEEQEVDTKYTPVFLSSNAIMLSGGIQLITRFFGEPEEIHATYDFIHCTCYWEAKDGELHLPARALEAILAKELFYCGSKYPLCSIIRTRKFIMRGWQINAGQYLKMVLQLNALDLLDRETLEDQLIGVDSAYFAQFIEATADLDPEKMNATYLGAIIDRIFE